MTAIYTYWSHRGWFALTSILRMVISFCFFLSILPLVCSIVCFTTLAIKALRLSLKMVLVTCACLVEIEIRLFPKNGASGRLKRITNMYLETTSTSVRIGVKPLDGGSGPSDSISKRSSSALLGLKTFCSGGCKCCLAIAFDLIQFEQLFMNSCFFKLR